MSQDDLLKALDIAPERTDEDEGTGLDPAQTTTTPPSAWALDLDAWSVRKGTEMFHHSDVMRAAMKPLAPEMVPDETWDGMPKANRDAHNENIKRLIENARHAAADFHAAAYEPTPILAEACTDETRHRYMEELLDSEAYQSLHTQTAGDALASELAAGHFAKGWCDLVADEAGQEQAQEPGDGQGEPPKKDDFQQRLGAMKAANAATTAAQEEVDELSDLRGGIGSGEGDGATVSASEMRKRFEMVKDSPQLRRIMALAGRFRRYAQARQRTKTIHGMDDMVGIEPGNDLGRLLPSELAQLADDDLQWLALRRYLERAMLQREHRSLEGEARGPIVVHVDESGSMDGEPIAMAKAFALAMAWIAKHQKRWICLVGFGIESEGNYLTMAPEAWDDAKLLDWCAHMFAGGTRSQVPLVRTPDKWQELGCPEGKTDIITITDGHLSVDDTRAASFKKWAEWKQVKHHVILLDCGDEPGDMAKVADQIWNVDSIDIETNAVQELMSL